MLHRAHRPATWARWAEAVPEGTETWVVFDNTAAGAALGNALELMGMMKSASI